MYGPEYEIIKEYEPYEKESKGVDNILDNNIEELIDIKYNKPIIKTEEKVKKNQNLKRRKKELQIRKNLLKKNLLKVLRKTKQKKKNKLKKQLKN